MSGSALAGTSPSTTRSASRSTRSASASAASPRRSPSSRAASARRPFSFAGEHYTITDYDGQPKPIQQPHPPIFIGGGGRRTLTLAAREANIVGLAPRLLSGQRRRSAQHHLGGDRGEAGVGSRGGRRSLRRPDFNVYPSQWPITVTDDLRGEARKVIDRMKERAGIELTEDEVIELTAHLHRLDRAVRREVPGASRAARDQLVHGRLARRARSRRGAPGRPLRGFRISPAAPIGRNPALALTSQGGGIRAMGTAPFPSGGPGRTRHPSPMPTQPDDHSGLWSPGRRALTTGLVLTVTLVASESLAVSNIMPIVDRDLGAGNSDLYGWVFSGFFLGNLIGIVVAGLLIDRGSLVRAFVLGLTLFSVGLLVGGLAPSMPVLVAARFVQGLGSGAIPPVAYVSIGRALPEALRPRMFATLSTAWVLPGRHRAGAGRIHRRHVPLAARLPRAAAAHRCRGAHDAAGDRGGRAGGGRRRRGREPNRQRAPPAVCPDARRRRRDGRRRPDRRSPDPGAAARRRGHAARRARVPATDAARHVAGRSRAAGGRPAARRPDVRLLHRRRLRRPRAPGLARDERDRGRAGADGRDAELDGRGMDPGALHRAVRRATVHPDRVRGPRAGRARVHGDPVAGGAASGRRRRVGGRRARAWGWPTRRCR